MSNVLHDADAKRYLSTQAEKPQDHYTSEQWVEMLERYRALRPPTKKAVTKSVRFLTELHPDGTLGVRQIVEWVDPAPALHVDLLEHAEDAQWAFPVLEESGQVVSKSSDDLVAFSNWQKKSGRVGFGPLYPSALAETSGKENQGQGKA